MRHALILPALLLAGCGAAAPAEAPPTASAPPSAPAPEPAPKASDPAPTLEPARCPGADSAACTAHTGQVIAIESVDKDGDGDLHVIAGGGSVTAPGITVFDVSAALRPATDPRPGDRVTGAGPVFRGSFRQRQIQATTFRVARAAG